MPEALKGIKQATAVCSRESAAAGTGAAVREPEPDLGCGMSGDAVQQLLRQDGSVAIDLRAAADFADYHIDGAVNASLADLLAKPYWRGKKVVLAGAGKGERELYAACARLKGAGYKHVAVLRGGITSWLASGKPVLGRTPSAQQLARLSAAELWQEGQFSGNLVVVDKEREALLGDMPYAVQVPELNAAAIRRVMEQRRQAFKGAPAATVVLVTGAAMPDQQLQALQAALAPQPLLVYTDTREAFSRQLATQKAIWLARANGPKQPACGQ
jgi:rhodanese-related sulfurtransferase